MLGPNAVSPAEQPRNDAGLLVRRVDQLDRPDGRLVRRADVRVVLAQIVARSRRSPRPGTGSSRAVEECESSVERGEPRADRCDVECCDAHETSLPLTIQRWRGLWSASSTRSSRAPPRATSSCRSRPRGRASSTVERRLDVDERVEAVLAALRHHAVRAPHAVELMPARRAVWSMLASVQRTSPASTRCSAHHSSRRASVTAEALLRPPRGRPTRRTRGRGACCHDTKRSRRQHANRKRTGRRPSPA